MAITTIPWGDGSGDNIYLSAPSQTGDQSVSVTSDPNTGAARSKVVTFSASGVSPVSLTINQEAGVAPQPTPIFELISPTTTQNYDTGIKLFDTPKSFTILCDATFNNYSWTAWTQGVFGISTAQYFRFGSINSGQDYRNDALYATANRYSAIIMNNTSSGKRCSSLFSRSNASTRRKFAVMYDHTSRKISSTYSQDGTVGTQWWTVPGDLESESTLQLLIGNATGTIHAFEIYNEVLSTELIADFMSN